MHVKEINIKCDNFEFISAISIKNDIYKPFFCNTLEVLNILCGRFLNVVKENNLNFFFFLVDWWGVGNFQSDVNCCKQFLDLMNLYTFCKDLLILKQ